MRLPGRIHILGASGSGTSLLAVEIARRYGHRHLDTDDYYWRPTSPPFREKRPADERLALLRRALRESSAWVLSGSLCGWGDPLVPEFQLVVFVYVPTPIRLARLARRELGRYGAEAIAPGGSLHRAHEEFMDWAGRYDAGDPEMRSRAMHDTWLARIACPVVRLEGDVAVRDQLRRIAAQLGSVAT
jgi:adenylate kinase family enzyme